MKARLELLRLRLGQSGPVRTSVPPRPNPDAAPLSAPQRRMWLHQQLHPASSAYNVCIRIDLAGDLDEARLLEALSNVIDRHEILRTTYPIGTDGEPFQRIHERLPQQTRIIDSEDPARIALEAASEPFDLASSGPIRAVLIRVDIAHWSLVLIIHHIVWDGGCFGVLSRDISSAYRGRDLPPLSVHYADIAAHQTRQDATPSTHLESQLDYWRRILTPLPPALPLPTAHPFGPDVSERASRSDRLMPTGCATGLRALASRLRTTPFAVFTAAYALLLCRWTGAYDITIGTMVSNRHQPGAGDLLGNFGNTVLLRLDLSRDPTFHRLAAHTTDVITGALGNADIAFERIIAELAPPREPGHGFLTDALGLFLDRDMSGPDLPGVEVQWENVFNGSSPFALTFQGFLTGDRLQVEATFRTDLFAPATVRRMLEHLEAILLAATADPDQRCSAVGRPPDDRREELARLGAGADLDLPARSVLEHWRQRVSATPDRIALVRGFDRFSYREIDHRADRLAARLLAQGVRAQDVVAVALGRGANSVVAPLAIWKIGAVYLPLDPHHPRARTSDLFSQAKARLLICNAGFDAGDILTLVADESTAEDHTTADPGYEPQALEAAHIGFTSGSTGRPKGVVTTHGSLAARTSWVAKCWPGGAGGARLAKSAPTAIDATAELCEAFVTGERLVLATDEEARDAAALAGLLETHGVGHFMAVPGLIEAAAIAAPRVIEGRDRVLSTGEPLLPTIARAIYQTAPAVALFNSYGCTETTGDVAAGPVSRADAHKGVAPIGNPLPGSRCYVLAADLTPAPQGVLGELYVEGAQLARGYLAQPAATAARFVANPFRAGERLYRTGDLARWREDGRLELAGRGDDQVSIRGHRVEPAEIVEALRATSEVQEAAVLPRAAGSTTELAAYVAGEGLKPEDGTRLRQLLARSLPGPLVPAEVIVLERLPRLAGGKIDRQALSRREAPPRAAPAAGPPARPPRDEHETALSRLLGDVLRREPVGVDDDFFALGGDSLLAVSFAARAKAAGLHFPAAAVFQYPTVAQLAENFPPPAKEGAEPLPLPAQLHRFRLSGLPIEEFVTWEALRGPTEPLRMERALAETISRHASLHRAIATRGRLWRSTRPSASACDARVIEIANSDAATAIEIGRSAIDVAAGRMIVGLVAADSALLVAHPVAIDGASLAGIAREVEARLQSGCSSFARFGAIGEIEASPPSPSQGGSARHPSHWESIMKAGPGTPWWLGPDDAPPTTPCMRARADAETDRDARIAGAFLQAARALSGASFIIADIEVDPDVAGPLLTMPVAARANSKTIDEETLVADASSYAAYLSGRRPTAGGPGILLRRTVTPEHWRAEGLARGTDRLYHTVGSWQRLDDRIALEVAACDARAADELVAAWAKALSERGGADE